MIRVIIERYIKDGSFHDYLDLIRRARKQASSNEGFIAGELLQEKSNPNHAVIISSWEDFKSWDEWQASSNRQSVLQQMRPLLERDEKVTVLEGSQLLK
jgi:heme-degrading monooxygenase HmoA